MPTKGDKGYSICLLANHVISGSVLMTLHHQQGRVLQL